MRNLLTLTLTLAASTLLACAADKLSLKPIEVQSITNIVLLKQLGQEDYPSQRATNIIATGDPRQRRFGPGGLAR